jgi:hypothetical protein
LPPQPDHSDGPNTLPAAELNPLLNPVLGQNMGRWAEVYFTSPPEKREQAVLELLRELRAENPELEGSVVSAAPLVAEAQQPSIVCRECGRENPASHRFCGMCGKLLGEAAASADLPIADVAVAEPQANLHAGDFQMAHAQTVGFHISDLHIEDQHIEDHPVDDRPQDEPPARSQNHETQGAAHREAVYEPALNSSELSLFQSGNASSYSDGQAEEMFLDSPPPRRYRVYVGIALAVVIFALGYMAWQSSQPESQSVRVAPQAPPAVTSQAATSAASPLETGAPARTPAANPNAAIPSNADRARTDRISGAGGRSEADVVPQSAQRATPITAEKTQTEALSGNGAEELAMAQQYLDGTNGQQRNQAEAAKWLWKAMAKHNATATLLLADLYLKGEGVSKNCDQARVLLDSATRAGVKDAAERLRHVQAFGCQ